METTINLKKSDLGMLQKVTIQQLKSLITFLASVKLVNFLVHLSLIKCPLVNFFIHFCSLVTNQVQQSTPGGCQHPWMLAFEPVRDCIQPKSLHFNVKKQHFDMLDFDLFCLQKT